MSLDFLPINILTSLQKLDLDKLYEIRLRKDYPIKVCYEGIYRYLSKNGVTILATESIICNQQDIENIINNVTEQSIYAYNEEIKNGYITTVNGIRIGLCGDCVYDNNGLVTLKNFRSLNIRIAHVIKNCSYKIFEQIVLNNEIQSTLIISPPFYGKTTILKDLATQINNRYNYPLLIIDERGEFYSISGENIDAIRYSDKYFAFNNGLRALSPRIIITDELITESDWLCAKSVVDSGVKIIASCHAKNMEQLTGKKYFLDSIFDKYIVLNNYGFIDGGFTIYNKDFTVL